MRITSFDKYNMSQIRLGQLQQYSNNLQIQIATGKEYDKISQSPVKANASLLVTSGLKRIEQFQMNLKDLKGYVQTAESYMGMAVDDYQAAMELAVKASNGTFNDDDRQSFVLEMNNIIEHMVGLGNSKHLDKYLFAGQDVNIKPLDYDGTTVTYKGSSDVNSIRITANMEVKTSVTAQDSLVGTIEAMIQLRDAINTGNTAQITTEMNNLQTKGEQVLNARSELGVRMKTTEMVDEAYNQNKLELKERKSSVEDVNMEEAIMQFMNAQQLYEGTVRATMKMYESSLMNYM